MTDTPDGVHRDQPDGDNADGDDLDRDDLDRDDLDRDDLDEDSAGHGDDDPGWPISFLLLVGAGALYLILRLLDMIRNLVT